MSFPLKGTVVPPQAVSHRLISVIGAKSRKLVARAAAVCEKTVSLWCSADRLPSCDKLITLMANDDDVFQAVLELAGRAPPASLNVRQRAAVAEALRLLEGRS